MPELICSNCDHHALDMSGVWCKEFREPIWDEKVAQECGAFLNSEFGPQGIVTEVPEPPEPIATKDSYAAAVNANGLPFVSSERQRKASMVVEIDYFGKEDAGQEVVDAVQFRLNAMFKERVKVTRTHER